MADSSRVRYRHGLMVHREEAAMTILLLEGLLRAKVKDLSTLLIFVMNCAIIGIVLAAFIRSDNESIPTLIFLTKGYIVVHFQINCICAEIHVILKFEYFA